MYKHFNLLKQIYGHRKALNSLKAKYEKIPNPSKISQLLSESLKNSLTNIRVSYMACNLSLKTNTNCKIDDNSEKQSVLTSKLESSSAKYQLTSRLRKIFTENKCKSVALGAAGIASKGANESVQSNATLTDSSVTNIEAIPEPPAVPDVTEFLSQLNALGEPTFQSIGLGGWTPVGIVQQAFEYFHVSLAIPWWTAIVIGTIIIRVAMFPLVIIAQRNAAKMNNNLPGMQAIQLKMTEARQTGNQLEVARYSQELMMFMKEKQMNPFKNMLVPFAQMPIFISFFMGLRQMANVPVDSMRTGGLFWFTDLTMPDQFFALPVITSLTLWATIELGTDSARLNSQNLQTMKYVLRALPVVIIPFTLNFPGAILCYWASSNFISLAQVGFLKIPAVREYFRIEATITHKSLPVKNKGFIGGIKDSWTNIKITKELEERRRIDDLQFQRAGKGPIVKTYKFDPTKVTAASTVNIKKS